MREVPSSGYDGDDISLAALWKIIWARRWLIVFVTAVSTLVAIVYAVMAPQWYRAEVVMMPAKETDRSPVLPGGLGGLAALANIDISGGESPEALAILKSREFAAQFISDKDLLPVFFEDAWDPERQRWIDDGRSGQPDIRDGIEFFHDNVLHVEEDVQTSLVTLGIEWLDPDIAADWAEALTDRLNGLMRDRALREAQENIVYLREELADTSVLALQQSMGRLLEAELQKLLIARGNEEFAFKVIDPALSPKKPVRPRRVLIVFLGLASGIFASLLLIFLVAAFEDK